MILLVMKSYMIYLVSKLCCLSLVSRKVVFDYKFAKQKH